MEAHKFLMFASLSPDIYAVIDLRRSQGSEDASSEEWSSRWNNPI